MKNVEFTTPEEAEQAFYEAFETFDLKAMMTVWADREFVECIHPMSDRAQGRSQVEASWRQIFDGGLRIRMQRTNIHRTQDALLAVHVLYEHLSITGETAHHPPIIATNIYQLIEGSWRMVLHHASPSPEDAIEAASTSGNSEGNPHRLH